MRNDDDFESLIDEFDTKTTLATHDLPNVPTTPIFPSVPSGHIFPRAPTLSEREKNIIISQRSIKFDEYVNILRETLNDSIRLCPAIRVSNKIKNNLIKINNLVTDIKIIDRNLGYSGGKKNNQTRFKQRSNKIKGLKTKTVKRNM